MKRGFASLDARGILAASAVAASAACVSSEPDPRSAIQAPPELVGKLAESVNGSELWQAYFETLSPSAQGPPLVEVRLELERRTRQSRGGDYDPGNVDIELTVTLLKNRSVLYSREESVRLDEFVVGVFDGTETREEIQEIAFRATESKVFPYLDRWINIAAIRAMGQEGRGGTAFLPILEQQAQDPWSEQLLGEARMALEQIRGE